MNAYTDITMFPVSQLLSYGEISSLNSHTYVAYSFCRTKEKKILVNYHQLNTIFKNCLACMVNRSTCILHIQLLVTGIMQIYWNNYSIKTYAVKVVVHWETSLDQSNCESGMTTIYLLQNPSPYATIT